MTKAKAIQISCGSILVNAGFIAVFAPDLVSGSEHGHIPLAAITVWIWAIASIGYVALLAMIRDGSAPGPSAWRDVGFAIAGIWLLGSIVSVWGPELVTDSDPTRVPPASLIAPPVSTIATAN